MYHLIQLSLSPYRRTIPKINNRYILKIVNNKILLFHPPSTTIIETTKKLHSNMLTFSELLVYCLFSFIQKAYKSEFENYILVLRVIC